MLSMSFLFSVIFWAFQIAINLEIFKALMKELWLFNSVHWVNKINDKSLNDRKCHLLSSHLRWDNIETFMSLLFFGFVWVSLVLWDNKQINKQTNPQTESRLALELLYSHQWPWISDPPSTAGITDLCSPVFLPANLS